MAYAKVESGHSNSKKKLPFLFKLTNRARTRTYIMPTGFGLSFGVMAVILLMMAVGYSNNLIYFFVFLLISLALTGMLVTNQNMVRIEVEKIKVDYLFANEDSAVGLEIKNTSRVSDSFFLEFCWGKAPASGEVEFLPSQKGLTAVSTWRPEKRGPTALPRLNVQSRFPFSLLQAWKRYVYKEEFLVFPERKGAAQFPRSALDDKQSGNLGLFRDHRLYQSTDSPRRIDWRATAKHRELLVKNFESPEQASFHFDWVQTLHIENFEERLSQMSLWIYQAEKSNHQYSMRAGEFRSGMSQGPAHAKKCLSVLALAKEGDWT